MRSDIYYIKIEIEKGTQIYCNEDHKEGQKRRGARRRGREGSAFPPLSCTFQIIYNKDIIIYYNIFILVLSKKASRKSVMATEATRVK